MCPPADSSRFDFGVYAWEDYSNGVGTDEEFSGTTLPSDFAAANSESSCSSPPYTLGDYAACKGVPSYGGASNPPGSYTAWFSPNQVTVSGGELHLGTAWYTGDTDCNDYWTQAVGDSTTGCWISGSVGQEGSQWAWQSGTTQEFAFEAKWTGNTNIDNLDSTLQAASYEPQGSWPPEIDVAETSYSGSGTGPSSGFNTFVHCPATNTNGQNFDGSNFDGTPISTPISTTMTGWHTYEVDVTPTTIKLYVDNTLKWTLSKSSSYCTTGTGGSGSDWIPSGGSLGAFMEAVMMSTGSTQTSLNQTMLVDWVAEA
jgi:hypothetical protein